MKLTEHFTLEEFTVSGTGERVGIDNTPATDELLANIQRTAQLLELIRTLLGKPIVITSGYRCPQLNQRVGGAANSAHMQGLAADILVPGYGSAHDVCRAIVPNMRGFYIDQLIFEFGSWTHVGLNAGAARHMVLTIDAQGTRAGVWP